MGGGGERESGGDLTCVPEESAGGGEGGAVGFVGEEADDVAQTVRHCKERRGGGEVWVYGLMGGGGC